MTSGFDVLVHDVIAASTTTPWPTACPANCSDGASGGGAGLLDGSCCADRLLDCLDCCLAAPPDDAAANDLCPGAVAPRHAAKSRFNADSGTRSCGRFGPATHGAISARSRSSVRE